MSRAVRDVLRSTFADVYPAGEAEEAPAADDEPPLAAEAAAQEAAAAGEAPGPEEAPPPRAVRLRPAAGGNRRAV